MVEAGIFELKVVKHKDSMIFAEVDGSFVNALFSLLTVPIGRIITTFGNLDANDTTPLLGCISHLHKSISDLKKTYFHSEGIKQSLLTPEFVYNPDLMIFKIDTGGHSDLSEYLVKDCAMDRPIFVITDDLRVFPHTILLSDMATKLGKEVKDATVEVMNIRVNKIMDLFAASLSSQTPLSDVLLFKKKTEASSGEKTYLFDISKFDEANKKVEGRVMKLKAIIQKSTRKFLYARAEKDFVEYLFSFVVIPLGLVDVGENSPMKGIVNLWSSLIDIDHKSLFNSTNIERNLMESTYANGCLTKNHMLLKERLSKEAMKASAHFPKEHGNLLKGPGMYLILDNLTVQPPYYMSSVLCNGISMSDLQEVEVHVGKKEALNILKFALTSEAALTKGLLDPIWKVEVVVD